MLPVATVAPQGNRSETAGAFVGNKHVIDWRPRKSNKAVPVYLLVREYVLLPMIEPVLVEVPNPAHPYGAKGVGEVNIVPPMAAIANAIDSAIHRRLTELPMSPPKVRAALDHTGADDQRAMDSVPIFPVAGLDPATHTSAGGRSEDVDGRVKPGRGERWREG